MKLLGIRMARSIWLFPQYFLNPHGVFLRPVIEAMKERYAFLKSPLDNPFPQQNEGYKFEQGMFSGSNGAIIISSVTFHDDGIVVDTRSSTDDGDAFLEDVLSWVCKEFGLANHVELPIKKIYSSELNVSYPIVPIIINPKLSSLLDDISSLICEKNKGSADFLGLQLSADFAYYEKPPQFRFEREINTRFDENRYYSYAPIKTDVHIKLLEKLEKLAT